MGGRAACAVGTAAVAICLLVASPALAAPHAGERYDGRSATGQRIYLTVRANGSRLDRYLFFVRTRCTDGRRRGQGLVDIGERPARIDPAGQFRYRSAAQRGSYPTRSGRVRGRMRLSFSGTFDPSGDFVTGTIRATFRSRRFDCSSGPVAFRVDRDGTAGAPWRDSVMATGLYTARGRGVTARLRTLAPARELLRGAFRYRMRCRSGATLRSGRVFLRYQLSEDGRRRVRGRASFRIRRAGVSVRARLLLKLHFFEAGGHQVRGTWRVRAVVSRGGRPIDTCRMRRSFAGTFQSGPA